MRIVDILMARDVHTAAKFELLKPEEFGRESGERDILYNLKSASNLNGNLNCSKELEHYAS